MSFKTAVLLTNLGTPESLDRAAVKRFLKQFLSDPMVVEMPRLPWWLILNGIILKLRSCKTLQGYA
ncbi:MAG: ferrochelatase, partial [Gammaproteobacteria bacterium]|nr:ferrochelatase [Gammaproteobacteria bacterium]